MTIQDVLEHYGFWAHGGHIQRVAAEWEEEGFTALEVDAWLEADVCWACEARQHADKGFTPDNWKQQH